MLILYSCTEWETVKYLWADAWLYGRGPRLLKWGVRRLWVHLSTLCVREVGNVLLHAGSKVSRHRLVHDVQGLVQVVCMHTEAKLAVHVRLRPAALHVNIPWRDSTLRPAALHVNIPWRDSTLRPAALHVNIPWRDSTLRPAALHVNIPWRDPTVEYCGCRNEGPLCWEPRAASVLLSKPAASHNNNNIAMQASSADRNFFLALNFYLPLFQVHSPSFFQILSLHFVWQLMQFPVSTHGIKQVILLIFTSDLSRFP